MARFFGMVICLMLLHSVFFELDSHDTTQIWIAGAAYAIIWAIREKRNG